jgi:hypothetical protein
MSWYNNGLDGRGLIPVRGRNLSLLHAVQTVSGVHPTSYPMGTAGSSTEFKRPASEADHSHLVPRSRMVELYLHSSIINEAQGKLLHVFGIVTSQRQIQGVSRLYGITATGDFLGLCDQKRFI